MSDPRDVRRRIAVSFTCAVCRIQPQVRPVGASIRPLCTKARCIDRPQVLSTVTLRPGSAFLCHRRLRTPTYSSPTRRPPRSSCQSPTQMMLSLMSHYPCQAMLFTAPHPVPDVMASLPSASIFLDICAGSTFPLGNAMLSKGAHVLVVDVLAGEGLDLCNDSTFEQLLR